MSYRCILWDWNGTLADDVIASLRATNDILKKRGRQPIDLEQYYRYIDSPISRFYEHLFDLTQVSMDEIGADFSLFYPQYFEGLQIGAKALLEKIHRAGIPQVILSASHRDTVTRDVNRLGIGAYFTEILGAENHLATGKLELGRQWLKAQTISPEHMVLIGDTLHDFSVASTLGIPCILCATGHQSQQDLLATGQPVVTDFSQLEQLLNLPYEARM